MTFLDFPGNYCGADLDYPIRRKNFSHCALVFCRLGVYNLYDVRNFLVRGNLPLVQASYEVVSSGFWNCPLLQDVPAQLTGIQHS